MASCNHGNVDHYHLVNLSNSNYNDVCWMTVDPRFTRFANISNDTSFTYSGSEGVIGGLSAAVVSIAGTLLNLVIILAVLNNSHLRKEYLSPAIVSLATTDFLYSLGCLPIFSMNYFFSDWSLTNVGCKFFSSLAFGLWLSTAWNLVAISALRCIAVYFPRRMNEERFRRACILVPLMAWLLSFLSLTPLLLEMYGQFGLQCNTFVCRIINMDSEQNLVSPHPKNILIAQIAVIAILLVAMNIGTYLKILKHSKTMFNHMKDADLDTANTHLERERKVGKMMAIIIGLYYFAYFPIIILGYIDPHFTITKPAATLFSLLINWSTVIIDPLIYTIYHEKYRGAIKMLLKSNYVSNYLFGHILVKSKTDISSKSKIETNK